VFNSFVRSLTRALRTLLEVGFLSPFPLSPLANFPAGHLAQHAPAQRRAARAGRFVGYCAQFAVPDRGTFLLSAIGYSRSTALQVNTGFGVLGKVYLDALTHINNRTRVRDPNAPGVKEAKVCTFLDPISFPMNVARRYIHG
jgi:hypothetical protein